MVPLPSWPSPVPPAVHMAGRQQGAETVVAADQRGGVADLAHCDRHIGVRGGPVAELAVAAVPPAVEVLVDSRAQKPYMLPISAVAVLMFLTDTGTVKVVVFPLPSSP